MNELTGSNYLQFTAEVWNPDAPLDLKPRNKKLSINREKYFPYLDMELYWRENELKFQVHLKENQLLKYLNQGSTHTKATFKSIPHGVLRRLANLTSVTPETENKRLNELYPDHCKALENAGLLPESYEYPTLREQILKNEESNPPSTEEATSEPTASEIKAARDKARATWFCIGYSKVWGEPISARLKRIKEKYGLTWLRNSMSYHKFSNLGEKFNGDLTGKMMKGIFDFNMRDRGCNCNISTLRSDKTCLFEGKCRKSMVIYELYCKNTGKSYYGKTQQYLKTRTMQHVYDVWKIIATGRKKFGMSWYGSGGYKRADSFSKHFAEQCRTCNNYNEVRAKMKLIMTPSILWQGDRTLCMKSARTMQCKICMVERITIMQQMKAEKRKVINDNSDIFSSCKCKSQFHTFFRNVTTISTLRTRSTQKEVNSTKKAKHKKSKRFSFDNVRTPTIQSPICQPCNTAGSTSSSSTEEPASPESVTPVFLFDNANSLHPNLDRAQALDHLDRLPEYEV